MFNYLLIMDCINYVDICCGLAWGDEAKGKIVSYLSKVEQYDFVCRWAGGNNAGHTIYINGTKYKTHLIPSGVFYGIKSIIGPDCVVNIKSFFEEINYLNQHGFDTHLIKISPRTHIVTDEHIEQDKKHYTTTLGTTSRGIAPCYRDKYARLGKRVMDYKEIFGGYIWDEKLYGKILCEGAQGFWLDINYGNYPYITSSNPLPYGACSIGFSPKLIRNIYGAAKIYDTRSGTDPDFPESLLEDKELELLGIHGEEYGVTTGRKRKTNWLNVDKLIFAINKSGTTHVIISKIDIMKTAKLFKFYFQTILIDFESLEEMTTQLNSLIYGNCTQLNKIVYSDNHETVDL
jgi:adenylosuccinate synthase